MVICLERGADLHMAQLMPLPLTVSCFSKIQIGFTFLVPAHPGSPGQRAVKRVCVCSATGETFTSLQYMYRVGRTTIGEIVIDTCQAITDNMHQAYSVLTLTTVPETP